MDNDESTSRYARLAREWALPIGVAVGIVVSLVTDNWIYLAVGIAVGVALMDHQKPTTRTERTEAEPAGSGQAETQRGADRTHDRDQVPHPPRQD